MPVRYLTVPGLLATKREVLRRSGQGEHPAKVPRVEATVALPQQPFVGRDLFPDMADKAAAYLYHVTQKHCFGQGNKRTAWAAARMFLAKNGYTLAGPDYSNARAIWLCLAIAKGECSIEQVATWLRRRIRLQRVTLRRAKSRGSRFGRRTSWGTRWRGEACRAAPDVLLVA